MSQLYFAYGSNMKSSRLKGRIEDVIDHGVATLQDYCIAFNKLSIDKSGKANIIPANHQNVLGVIYEVSEEQLKILDKSEPGYLRIPKEVDVEGKVTEVQVYVAMEKNINNDLFPTERYLGYLIDGAVEHNFPEAYQEFLINFEVCK